MFISSTVFAAKINDVEFGEEMDDNILVDDMDDNDDDDNDIDDLSWFLLLLSHACDSSVLHVVIFSFQI